MALRSSFQRVRALLGQDRALAVLLPEAARLRGLNAQLGRVLPRAVAASCQVVLVRDGEALILCGNGASAARVRSQAGALVRALAGTDAPVDRIKVQVRADWARPDPPAKPGLDRRALATWRAFEAALPEGDLKAAVERLVRHHRPG